MAASMLEAAVAGYTKAPERYASSRPAYPPALLDDLFTSTSLQPGVHTILGFVMSFSPSKVFFFFFYK